MIGDLHAIKATGVCVGIRPTDVTRQFDGLIGLGEQNAFGFDASCVAVTDDDRDLPSLVVGIGIGTGTDGGVT